MVEVHPASLRLELALLRTFERFAAILEVSGQIPPSTLSSSSIIASFLFSLSEAGYSLTHHCVPSDSLEIINRLLKISTILHL